MRSNGGTQTGAVSAKRHVPRTLADTWTTMSHSRLRDDCVRHSGDRGPGWPRTTLGALALALSVSILSGNLTVSRAETIDIISGYGRAIHFSGYDWLAKRSSVVVGPGPNYFSDSFDNVWTDDNGRLHLRLTRDANGQWWASEVVLQASLGYGTYTFELDGTPNQLDVNAVFGMFTWNDDPTDNHREMDIEIARWGQPLGLNGRYTVQPYLLPDRMYEFQQPPIGVQTSQRIDWQPERVTFQSWMGSAPSPSSPDPVVAQHTFDSGVPHPGGEQARINLWLDGGLAPVDTSGTEVIVRKFEFVPMSPRLEDLQSVPTE